MQAIANTSRLVSDGVITKDQATTIESRARQAMVFLAVNAVLCFGIIAATGGFIVWLGTPFSVAILGLIFLGMGTLILAYGGELFRMFGNASTLIGAGMLIGGAYLELIEWHNDMSGPAMTVGGFIIVAIAAWLLKREHNSARFVTGAILLMGLALHLFGIAYALFQANVSGPAVSAFYIYNAVAIVAAGWFTNVRLVTALAIVPFAQALDTSAFYLDAAYAFYSPEPTLSILQMSVLVACCVWLAARRPERIARHARVLAVMAFIVANLCALVGSLFGDYVGETIWGPTYPRYSLDTNWEDWRATLETFRETALYLSADLYSALWAIALAALIFWSAHKSLRGLFNASLTFAGIHAYTQFFERFYEEPMAYVIGGIIAIPLAWLMWRFDKWIVAKREVVGTT